MNEWRAYRDVLGGGPKLAQWRTTTRTKSGGPIPFFIAWPVQTVVGPALFYAWPEALPLLKTLILRHLRKNLMVPVTGGSQWTCQRPSPANETDGPRRTRHRPVIPRYTPVTVSFSSSGSKSLWDLCPHQMPIQYCCQSSALSKVCRCNSVSFSLSPSSSSIDRCTSSYLCYSRKTMTKHRKEKKSSKSDLFWFNYGYRKRMFYRFYHWVHKSSQLSDFD
jgi:hypothetical protein